MRSSRQDTEKHRKEIIEASARLFREKGVENVSVPELMQAVGMTHGGFYKHFSSKDDLVPIAYDTAFGQVLDRLKTVTGQDGDGPNAAWNALVSYYLTAAHRDNPGDGCATAALAGDTARLGRDSQAQAAYEHGVEGMLEALDRAQDGPERRAKSLVALSTMVGALLLSRSTTGALSDQFLDAARTKLLNQASEG